MATTSSSLVVQSNRTGQWGIPDCYIYLYHTDECFILPQFPDAMQDNLTTTFAQQNALSRTAPVFAYSNSGPRTVQINLKLHRDIMTVLNKDNKTIRYTDASGNVITKLTDDYVDILIKKIQAIALPKYQDTGKMVQPPMVAVRISDEVFIKGVVTSGIGITYDLPLLENGKYAVINIAFTVSEVQPYDAETVGYLGSFRGLTSGLRAKMGG